MVLHWVRLTSAYNCGVAARNTVISPISPGCLLPTSTRRSAFSWRLSRPSLARSSTISRKPPALPSPRTGGEPYTDKLASGISS